MSDSRQYGAPGRGSIEGVLDSERCYRAVASRDARFDGVFVTAVRTTGIYCRPSCPATTPKRRNVEFFRTAGAAQQHGYRACRRCLPDAVPGSPEWNTRSDLAARAMRLIGDGLVERAGIGGLAARLGYSERHLNRIVTAELGAGPLALARAYRAHTARLLIENTAMPMAEIAFAAGFASVRQFNETVREVYAVTPTVLRRDAARRADPAPAAQQGALVLRLPFRPPFDAVGLLRFAASRALAGLESVESTSAERAEPSIGTEAEQAEPNTDIEAEQAEPNTDTEAEQSEPGHGTVHRRTLRLPHGPATVEIDLSGRRPSHVPITLRLAEPRDLGPAVARLRRLLDLDADPVAVDALLGADPLLAPAVAAVPGIRLPGAVDGFEIAVRALLGQQVSVAAARTAGSRLVAALGDPVPDALGGGLLFPSAETVAARGADVLAGPARRTASIVGLAAAVAEGRLVLDAGRDPAELRAELLALPGVGPWTAGYVAMRLLGDPDELLAADLAVRRGAARLGLPGEAAPLERHGERWRPWRSYAATHLWRAAAAEAGAAEPAAGEDRGARPPTGRFRPDTPTLLETP